MAITSLTRWLSAAVPAAAERPAAAHHQHRIATRWREHAGAAAAHSEPLLFTSGRLVVFAERPIWGGDIRHRAPGLIAALRRDGLNITALEVKTRPTNPPPPPVAVPAPTLSPHSAALIRATAGEIEHGGLRGALLRLAARGGRGGDGVGNTPGNTPGGREDSMESPG